MPALMSAAPELLLLAYVLQRLADLADLLGGGGIVTIRKTTESSAGQW